MKLYAYPIKPHILSQGWGIHRPEIYSQFGFSDHNGLDHLRPVGPFNVYAPCKTTVLDVFSQPEGGGNVLSLITEPVAFDPFYCITPDRRRIEFGAGTYRVRIDFLHLEKALVKIGDIVEAGDLIAMGDNTGFSTGPHCHTQWRRVLDDGNYTHADANQANNSFDPSQFFDGFYAQDLKEVTGVFRKLIPVLEQWLASLKASA
jgi:hypothetical protein